jgi:hypothetical protein
MMLKPRSQEFQETDSRSLVTIKLRSRRSDLVDGGSSLLSFPIQDLPHFNEKKPRYLPWYKINWQKFTHAGNPAVAFWTTILLGTLLYFANGLGDLIFITTARFLEGGFFTNGNELKVMIQNRQGGHSRPIMLQFKLEEMYSKSREKPDFGGLVINNRTRFDDPIEIPVGYFKSAAKSRQEFLAAIDVISDRHQPESSKEDENPKCRKVSWALHMFPSCNQIHENSIERIVDDDGEYTVSYLR